MRPIVFAIHGILTGQTSASWPDRFDAWCESNGVSAHVLKREYVAGPVPSWNVFVKNWWLAKECVAEILPFAGRNKEGTQFPRLHFVAHSNGTDVALKAVKLLARRGIQTDTLIVVGSVLPPDIRENGVALLMEEGFLRKAVAYVSQYDGALGVERWLPWCAYKDLGRVGWQCGACKDIGEHGVQCSGKGLVTRHFDTYGHGTYFDPECSEGTFELFIRDMGLLAPPNKNMSNDNGQ